MAVLIVGGSGYVGQFVIKALLSRNYEVHLTHRPGRELELPTGMPSQVRCHPLDLADPRALAEVLQEVQPIAIVNCAAMSALGACERDPEAATAVNFPRALVEAIAAQAAESPRLFVHFSTDIVFDGDAANVYTEESETRPVNTYGRIKAEFDAYLAERSKPTPVVLRPTNIVGPVHPFGPAVGGGTKFLQWLDGRLRANEPTKLFMDEFRNYVWVEDLVDVVLRLIEDFPSTPPPHKLMHCGGPESLSRVDVAQVLAAAKGYSLTYKDEDGNEQPRIAPTPRSEVNLGYPSPLCIRFLSERAEAYLGRPFRTIAAWLADGSEECPPQKL